jgi:hypothetical protein
MTVLEYSKMILEKVSFDARLFKKELRKALRWVSKEEMRPLILWCRQKYNIKKNRDLRVKVNIQNN